MNRISSIVITYNPDIERLSFLLKKLVIQCNDVIVIDNFSKNIDKILDMVSNINSTSIVRLDANYGIAYAQNIGINKIVQANNSNFLIFFDQDSNIPDNFVSQMVDEYQSIKNKNINIGLLAPALYNDIAKYFYPIPNMRKKGMVEKIYVKSNQEYIETNMIVSSGSIMTVEFINHIGGMIEPLFIDAVDTEFSIRAYKRGYKSFVTTNIVMNHTIGNKPVKFLKYHIQVHNPLRRYYMLRNFLLLRNLDYIPRFFILYMTFRFFVSTIIILCISDQKKEYIGKLLKSLKDGLLNKELNKAVRKYNFK